MELIKNLRYMCRICAVNIKKRRSSSSAVSILETTQLTEKLKKYLNIDINYNDVLPKSICSVCYKKVEAIHALSALAKKTENFLTDFIKIAQNNLKQQAQAENLQTIFNQNDEFNQFTLLDNNDCNINDNDIICCEDDQQQHQQQQQQQQLNSDEHEEVVLNFTLNDPLTKNIQKKIVVAKQKKHQQHLLNQRQQLHKKFQEDLLQLSTSITPTTSNNNKNNQTANDLISELQAFNKRNESLEQKRQNLKMILNNNTPTTNNSTICQQQLQNHSPESTNNYKLIIPNSGGSSNINQSGSHSINVAVQIQQQPTTIYSTNQQQQSDLAQQQQHQIQNMLINNNRTAQMMNEYLNLGSVIKDMDLLKLILKALKWPFNQESLNTQIQRLKNTRFRDVMVDPNLLQDTDLMQILSSYLSPILLQTSPTQTTTTTNLSSTSPSSSNILPPSVSYKIPAETSVRLVCVPRDDQQHQQNEQKHLTDQENYQQTTISSSSSQQSTKKHHHSYNFDCKSYDQHKKSKKKHFKFSENHHRRLQQQNCEPIIILSDDESHNSSDNIQKFEVNVDPMLYFNGADSSYENSNESTMITMGYFKHHQQQQQQQQQQHQHQQPQQQYGMTALNSEVTLQKRKKQKRKQTLIQNPNNKNALDQEILIIDENGEKPIQLNNELLCIPSKKKSNDNNLPSTSKNIDDNLNLITSNFEFTTPKKRRKLNTLKSSKENDSFPSKYKVPQSESMVIIHKPEIPKVDNKFTLQKEIKLEKNLNDVSIIAVNKNYESTKKFEATNKPTVELMPKKHNNNDKRVVENILETFDKNIIKEQKDLDEFKNKEIQMDTSLTIEKLNKSAEEKTEKQREKNQEPSEIIDELKIISGARDDDADSVDTNGELVIDEAYDEEKLKDDENKIESSDKEMDSNLITLVEEIESKTDTNMDTTDEVSPKTTSEGISKTIENDTIENNTLRRSRRQTNFKTPILKSVRKNKNIIKKNLVTSGATVVTNVKNTVVSTRGKTRQQEQKSKMQTRNSNISQRGREQKPFTKYSKKKS